MTKKYNDIAISRAFDMPDVSASGDDEQRIIEGHAAVFNQKADIAGLFWEVIERNAFDDTDFRDVLFCINHDLTQIPIARSRRNNDKSTMQLKVDESGLHIRAVPDLEHNPQATSLYHSIARGDTTGMSLIMWVAEDRWEDLDRDMPTRYITKITKVREVTATAMPAYQGTDIHARSQLALENAKTALENARASSELENSAADGMLINTLRAQILSD